MPIGRASQQTLTLTYEDWSERPLSVSFFVRVPKPFAVSPKQGILEPGQSVQLELSLAKQSQAGVLAAEVLVLITRPPPAATAMPVLKIPVTAAIRSVPKSKNGDPNKPSPPRWNSWIREHPAGAVVSRLEPKKEYDLQEGYDIHFDLAAFDYSKYFVEVASTLIDVDFARELSSIPHSKIEVLVVPVLLGHGLKFLPGEDTARKYLIDLDKLRNPPENWSRSDPLPDFAEKVKAMRATVGVTASGAGCAAVALTIWNPSLNRPLDHVVRQVSVGPAGSAPACKEAGNASPVKAGLLSLLALPFDRPATAALHIFETRVGNSEPVTTAVFLKSGDPLEVLSWTPARQISDYIGKDGPEGLRRQIELARCVKSGATTACVHDYSAIAEELAAVLFHDDEPTRQSDANRALAVLQELTSRTKPDVFVRLIDVNGRNLFLPLGLLGLGPGQLLGRKANLMTPMPKERHRDPDRCIGSWKMVLPEHLAGVDDTYLEKVDLDIPDAIRIGSWSDFKTYAAADAGSTKTAEGFLLLAHHGGGRVAFDPDSTQSLRPEGFKHPYPPGSVAILAGCSVGQLVGDNKGLPLLTRLNDLGISAAILSPFDIQAPLGARFAMHFANEIQRARRDGEEAELRTLFDRTLESVRREPAMRDFAAELDELLIVGDSRARLCRKGNGQ